jgi:hypothetical protein
MTRITGNVVDRSGKPIGEAKVEILDGQTVIFSSPASDRGEFQWEPGVEFSGRLLEVRAKKEGFVSQSKRCRVDGESAAVSIELVPIGDRAGFWRGRRLLVGLLLFVLVVAMGWWLTRRPRDIALVGHDEHVRKASAIGDGFRVKANMPPERDDVVLFVFSAADGPMPQTRIQIESLAGKTYGPSAIFMVDTNRVDDAELQLLVIQEMRELLARNNVPNADSIEVITDSDPRSLDSALRRLTKR